MEPKRLIQMLIVMSELSICCSKNNGIVRPVPISAFTVVNAAVGSSPIITNFSDSSIHWFSTAQSVNYGSFFEYSIPSNQLPIKVYQNTDTTHTIFNATLDLKPYKIYTLFICGQILQNAQTAADTILSIDTPPYHDLGDSVTGVRFANLILGGNPVSINLIGSPYGSEVTSLPYKAITQFKNYSATSQITNYTYEIRDAISGILLASLSYSSLARFKNVTIVLKGVFGGIGSSSVSAFLVNNY